MASSPSRRCTCPSLTDDILLEIFAYLPLDSIHRFKSISKVWLSNLSHPNFITKWYQINNKSLPWIHYHKIFNHRDKIPLKLKSAYPHSHSEFMSRNQHLFSFNFLINEKQIQGARLYLLGSSNGLVLCQSLDLNYQKMFHVCNPLTLKWVSIPSPPHYWSLGLYDFEGVDYNGIVCENSLSAEICCYKVILIPRFLKRLKRFNVDIFASDLGEWTRFEVSCDQDVSRGSDKNKNVITLNGVLFWLEGGDKMVVYDLNQNNASDEHRCSLVDLPTPRFVDVEFDNEVVSYFSHTLGESEGWVCYARTRITGRRITVSVWVFDGNNNWQIFHKDISVHDTLADICAKSVRVIGFSPYDRNVVLLGGGCGIWWFIIQTKRFQELVHSSPLTKGLMLESFVLKTMPTGLPPPSWIDT